MCHVILSFYVCLCESSICSTCIKIYVGFWAERNQSQMFFIDIFDIFSRWSAHTISIKVPIDNAIAISESWAEDASEVRRNVHAASQDPVLV